MLRVLEELCLLKVVWPPFSFHVSWKSTPLQGRAVVPSGPSHHPADFPSLYRTFPSPPTYPEDGPITDEKMDSPDQGLTNEKTDLLDGLTQSLPVLLDLALLYHCSSYLYLCSLLFGSMPLPLVGTSSFIAFCMTELDQFLLYCFSDSCSLK